MEWLALMIPAMAVIAIVVMYLWMRSNRRRRPGRDYSDEPSAVVLGAAAVGTTVLDQEGGGAPGADHDASPAPSDLGSGGDGGSGG
jgi:hypothetical protein